MGRTKSDVQIKFRKVGPLGLTAEEYRAAGCTPHKLLEEHPGKTLAEVLDIDSIQAFLEGLERLFEQGEDGFRCSAQRAAKEDFDKSLCYLQQRGILPEKYQQRLA